MQRFGQSFRTNRNGYGPGKSEHIYLSFHLRRKLRWRGGGESCSRADGSAQVTVGSKEFTQPMYSCSVFPTRVTKFYFTKYNQIITKYYQKYYQICLL
jgi:hypothetical protein